MSSLKKKLCSLVSKNRHPTYPLVEAFKNFVILSRAKRFFKDTYVLYFVCVWKRMVNICVLCFFIRLLLSNLYKQLSSSIKFSAVLGCPLDYYFNNLSKKIIICPQQLDALIMLNRLFIRSLGHWNLSQTHRPIHTVISTPCYLRLKRRPRIFKKFLNFVVGQT